MNWIYSILLQEPFKMEELKREKNPYQKRERKLSSKQTIYTCLQVIPERYPYHKGSIQEVAWQPYE